MHIQIEGGKAILKDEERVIYEFEQDKKDKKKYITQKEENGIVKKFIYEYSKCYTPKQATEFLHLVLKCYSVSMTIVLIQERLSVDRQTAKNLLCVADENEILKKYGTYWRINKDKLKDLYNYMETEGEQNAKGK